MHMQGVSHTAVPRLRLEDFVVVFDIVLDAPSLTPTPFFFNLSPSPLGHFFQA